MPLIQFDVRPALLCVILSALAAGCSHVPPSAAADAQQFDLGPPATVAVAPNATTGAVGEIKVTSVRASAALSDRRIHYRLLYADAQEPRSYAHSAWTATPAQLYTDRLRTQLAGHLRVLDNGDASPVPVLTVELLDFSQVFSAPEQGEGQVILRATLADRGHAIAQRDFSARTPSPSADARGAAGSIAVATQRTLAQLQIWLDQQLPRR